MSTVKFPLYLWFKNGNPYSGAIEGMRYVLLPGRRPDPADEAGKKKIEFITVKVWPEPWSMEHTAPEKIIEKEFAGTQAGLDEITGWLMQTYEDDKARWDTIPSILDGEPDC